MHPSRGLSNILRALRTPSYGLYTIGNGASLIGSWMQRVAVGWLAWDLTHSGAWLGTIVFLELFPTVVVGPFAGAVADSADRLRLIRRSQSLALLQAVALWALSASGHIEIYGLAALTLFLGVVAAYNQPARLALIPSLVTADSLTTAVAINSVVFNAARFIGPALAGLIIVGAHISYAFAANALSFLVFLYTLYRIRPVRPDPAPPAQRPALLRTLRDGLAYASGHEVIAPLLVLLIVVSLCARPTVELFPGFAGAVFHAGASGLALLTSTVGIGAVIGGIWLAGRSGVEGLARIVLLAVAAIAVALIAFVATADLRFAVVAAAALGLALVIAGAGSQTVLQMVVEDRMRGRVLSLYGLIMRGAPALGAVIIGPVSDHVGLRLPVGIGALLVLLAVAWAARRVVVGMAHAEASFGGGQPGPQPAEQPPGRR